MSSSNKPLGYELLSFVFWLPMQAVVIGFLDAFEILPSTIAIALGWGGQPLTSHHFPFAIDTESNYREIKYTTEEMESSLNQDLALFRNWLSARAQFVKHLEEQSRTIFSSQTGYWLNQCLVQYKEKFIND